MQFSDTSDLNGLIEDITFITKVDTQEYKLKDRTRNANQWYFRTIKDIIAAVKENAFQDTSLTSGTDNSWTVDASDGSATRNITNGTRGYALPTTNRPWLIYRVAYMRDGTNFYDSVPFHIGSVAGNMNETNIDSNIDQTKPMHRYNGDTILLYPKPNANVTGGIKIWYIREPASFLSTDTTKLAQVNAAFHRIISLGASYDYFMSRGKPMAATVRQELEQLRTELREFYSRFLDDSQPVMKPDLPNYA